VQKSPTHIHAPFALRASRVRDSSQSRTQRSGDEGSPRLGSSKAKGRADTRVANSPTSAIRFFSKRMALVTPK